MDEHTDRLDSASRRRRSVGTALALAAVALVFFLAVVLGETVGASGALITTGGIGLMVILGAVLLVSSRK